MKWFFPILIAHRFFTKTKLPQRILFQFLIPINAWGLKNTKFTKKKSKIADNLETWYIWIIFDGLIKTFPYIINEKLKTYTTKIFLFSIFVEKACLE